MCLPFVYLMSSHMTKSSRPSPSIFAYPKQSYTGGGNSLGMRLQDNEDMHADEQTSSFEDIYTLPLYASPQKWIILIAGCYFSSK